MESDQFKIYVDRLRGEKSETISFNLDATFLDVTEKDLTFSKEISVEGETYIADEYLIIRFSALTVATLPCSICNEGVDFPIELKNFYHTEPLEEIKGAIFDFKDLLRDTILLQAPLFAECIGGCQERSKVNKYFKESPAPTTNKEYFPFESL